jgi:hypothetical protein
MDEEVRPPPALTNAVSWRGDDHFYKKNEVFLDVTESVNLLVSPPSTRQSALFSQECESLPCPHHAIR